MQLSLLPRMARAFSVTSPFPHSTASVATTEMREELGFLCGHMERATLAFCGPRGQGETRAMGRRHGEPGRACVLVSVGCCSSAKGWEA